MASVYWSILQAVVSSVSSVVENTVLRKKLEAMEHTDTLPICIVAPGVGGEKVDVQTFKKDVVYRYPVLVLYLEASDGTVGLQQGFMDAREAIRNKLYTTLLPGVTPVWDTEIDPDAAEKYADYTSTNFDVAVWSLSYRASEVRSA